MAARRSHRFTPRPLLGAVGAAALAMATTVSCATMAGVPHPSAPAAQPPLAAAASVPGPVTLSDWKLTLPVAGPQGHAASLDPARLSPPWLTSDGGGAITLWAPVRGATTPNSGHARTELVSLEPFRAGQDRRRMTASVTVSQVPRGRPDVIIGQIHGAQDLSSVAFVMLHYDAGDVGVVVKQADTANAVHVPLITGVPLGGRFTFTISDDGNGTMTFAATGGGHTATARTPLPAFFAGRHVRFQTGAYQQADSSTADGSSDGGGEDGARVTLHGLTVGS